MANYNPFGEKDELNLTATLRAALPVESEWKTLTARVRRDAEGLVEFAEIKVVADAPAARR